MARRPNRIGAVEDAGAVGDAVKYKRLENQQRVGSRNHVAADVLDEARRHGGRQCRHFCQVAPGVGCNGVLLTSRRVDRGLVATEAVDAVVGRVVGAAGLASGEIIRSVPVGP